MSDIIFDKQRFIDLANMSYNNTRYAFTNFLSMAELSEFHAVEDEVRYAYPVVYGGCEIAERKMIRFGNPSDIGYEEDFAISLMVISPVAAKFADALTHRDFLGALMNLGIKREMLGDIFVKNNEAYVFCNSVMTDYIRENLTRIKHTTVVTRVCESLDEYEAPKPVEKIIQVSSVRIDAVTARVYNLSRGDSLELFTNGLVFLNGRACTENAKALKNGDVISVRGHGRYIFDELINTSKKGKENCRILVYK